MKIQLLLVLLLLPLLAVAQYDFSGTWEGELTQGDGGYAPVYKFKLHIEQEGLKITGRTFVEVGEIYAEWKFKGRLIGNKAIHWEETELMEVRPHGVVLQDSRLVSDPQRGRSQARRAVAREYRPGRLHTGQDHRQEDFAPRLTFA